MHLFDKFERVCLAKDISSFQNPNSNSLWFRDNLNYEISQSSYFNFIRNINQLRIISQLRLCNRFNERIILKNLLFKVGADQYCYACNTKFNLVHILNDCIIFNDLRRKYFDLEFPLFREIIEYVSESNVNNIIKFMNESFEKFKTLI